jgi:multidrug efflux pump subunit AcrA (membrane-fusion protein)
MANHVLTCPVCHSALLIAHNTSLGGQVMDNLVLLDSAKETALAAAARATLEAAQAATVAAQEKLDTAVAALESARQATPPDDAKVTAAEADVATAKAEFDAAVKEEADAQTAYDAALAVPPPPAVGTLSPDGNWTWTGDEWEEVAKTPPPLPAGVVAETPAEEAAELAETPVTPPSTTTAVVVNG